MQIPDRGYFWSNSIIPYCHKALQCRCRQKICKPIGVCYHSADSLRKKWENADSVVDNGSIVIIDLFSGEDGAPGQKPPIPERMPDSGNSAFLYRNVREQFKSQFGVNHSVTWSLPVFQRGGFGHYPKSTS